MVHGRENALHVMSIKTVVESLEEFYLVRHKPMVPVPLDFGDVAFFGVSWLFCALLPYNPSALPPEPY